MNVLARCGWTRFFAYCMLKRLVGLPSALVLAPSAYGKLFDEIKIYVGCLALKTLEAPCLNI